MVVHDFNPGGRAVLPHEADPIPLVNPDAVLAGSVALEGGFGNRFKFPGPEAVENLLRLDVFEAAYQVCIVYR